MSLIVAGYTFSDGVQDQGTAAALGTFMSNALVTGTTMSEFRTTAHIVQVSATTPASDQGEGSLWFDSTLNLLRVKNGTRWDCQYVGAEMLNSTGATIPQGAWVVGSSDNTMSPCATGSWPEIIGVTEASCANGAKMIVRRTGLGMIRVVGPITYGDYLVSAPRSFGADGWARAATMISGYGNTSFTAGLEIGMALGSLSGNTTGLMTGLVWR